MKKRILVVEDDLGLARVICDNLALEGYDVAHVADGTDAASRIRRIGPMMSTTPPRGSAIGSKPRGSGA